MFRKFIKLKTHTDYAISKYSSEFMLTKHYFQAINIYWPILYKCLPVTVCELVETVESLYNAASIDSLVVDEELMRPGH